jgi:hypothetical protein
MALDSRNKRGSALGIGLAALVVLPAPDGAIAQADRQQAAYSYAGIAAGALFTYNFVEFDDVTVKAAYFDNATLEPGD